MTFLERRLSMARKKKVWRTVAYGKTWTDGSCWSEGVLPKRGAEVIISHAVILDTDLVGPFWVSKITFEPQSPATRLGIINSSSEKPMKVKIGTPSKPVVFENLGKNNLIISDNVIASITTVISDDETQYGRLAFFGDNVSFATPVNAVCTVIINTVKKKGRKAEPKNTTAATETAPAEAATVESDVKNPDTVTPPTT